MNIKEKEITKRLSLNEGIRINLMSVITDILYGVENFIQNQFQNIKEKEIKEKNKRFENDLLKVIIEDYITLFLSQNRKTKSTLKDSFELSKDIFVSRLASPSYKYNSEKENLTTICYSILSSISNSKIKKEKVDIKSCAKLISYLNLKEEEVSNIFDYVSKNLTRRIESDQKVENETLKGQELSM